MMSVRAPLLLTRVWACLSMRSKESESYEKLTEGAMIGREDSRDAPIVLKSTRGLCTC